MNTHPDKKKPAPNKDWAMIHRNSWLNGARLSLYQVTCASEALKETWIDEGGLRRCVPLYTDEDEA